MVIRPADIHEDSDKARLGVGLACEALGVRCELKLASLWLVKIHHEERETFIALAREAAETGRI